MILSKALSGAAVASRAAVPDPSDRSRTRDAGDAFGGLLDDASRPARRDRVGDPPATVDPRPTFTLAPQGASATSASAPPSPDAAALVPAPAPTPAAAPTADTGAQAAFDDLLSGLPALVRDAGEAPERSSSRSNARSAAKADAVRADDPAAAPPSPDLALLSSLIGMAPVQPAPAADTAKPAAAEPGAAGSAVARTDMADRDGPVRPSQQSALPAASAVASQAVDAAAAKAAADGAATEGDPSSRSSPGKGSHGGAAAPATAMVRSVAVETHLMPAASTPMQQVIATVEKLVAAPAPAAGAAVVDPVQTARPASRTVTLVLEPENLGTVTVRMQMRGDSLDLQLDVADSQTLAMLNKDRDRLATAVGGQDYTLGTLTLRASDTQTASQGSDNGAQSQTGGSAPQSSRHDDGSSRGAQQNPDGGSAHGGGSSAGARRDRQDGRSGAWRGSEPAAANPAGVYI